MTIPGIGLYQTYGRVLSSTDSGSLCAGLSTPMSRPSDDSLRVTLEFRDVTVTIDILFDAAQRKTTFELSRYTGYTYGNDNFSPEQTANRIIEFAMGLWDGSEEQLEILSGAIDQGIAEARKILGTIPGWLDGIISTTEDLLHERLHAMREGLKIPATSA